MSFEFYLLNQLHLPLKVGKSNVDLSLFVSISKIKRYIWARELLFIEFYFNLID